MVNENINTSHAHLKELKSQTHQLLRLLDQLEMVSYWLRQVQRSIAKVCEEMNNKVA